MSDRTLLVWGDGMVVTLYGAEVDEFLEIGSDRKTADGYPDPLKLALEIEASR